MTGIDAEMFPGIDPDNAYQRVVVAISDLHQETKPDGRRNELRYVVLPRYLSQYADAAGADELWNGGDSGNKEDIEALLGYGLDEGKIPAGDPRREYGFERMKLVIGDEDEKRSNDHVGWYAALREDQELQKRMEEDRRVEYGRKVATAIPGSRPYLVQMAHEPLEFGIDWDTTDDDLATYRNHQLDQPKVVLYGHVHTPCARVLRNSVAIGMGSSAKNYWNGEADEWAPYPDRSMYVLSFQPDAVDAHLIDLTEHELFRHQRFAFDGTRFTEVPVDESEVLEPVPAEVVAD